MARVAVAGLINIETTLRVEGFPIDYFPVRYAFDGVESTVSGVGYNVAKALTVLGHEVRFASLIGQDALGTWVLRALESEGIAPDGVLQTGAATAQSVILYDGTGRRQINVDLKDLQTRVYPQVRFSAALDGAALAVLCNINFSRPLLRLAKARGVSIATDVHTLSDVDDAYNRDFMAAATVLFMSDEALPTSPEVWAREILARYPVEILVIGLGAQGALLAVRGDGFVGRFPAVQVRPVVNTIGAGDALFTAFVHGYVGTGDPYAALRQAQVFAAYKIGARGAAEGFLSAPELQRWCAQVYGPSPD